MDPEILSQLGPLGTFAENGARDIAVTADGRAWTRFDGGFESTDVVLHPRETRRIGVGLIELGGGRVDDAKPTGDSAIAGRVRIHMALPPISRHGPVMTLRFPRKSKIGESDFRVVGDWKWTDLDDESVLVTGPTGSGKTTLLETLCARIPKAQRIVVIEDLPETDIAHPHAIHLTTRDPNPEGAGAVGMGDLVRQSLRMSPDRIVVGEVRGAEILDLVLALSAGHRGFATLHARTLDEVPGRLVALGSLAGLEPAVMNRLAALAITRVVSCAKTANGFEVNTARLTRRGDELMVVP